MPKRCYGYAKWAGLLWERTPPNVTPGGIIITLERPDCNPVTLWDTVPEPVTEAEYFEAINMEPEPEPEPELPPKYKCPECQVRHKDPDKLEAHIRQEHTVNPVPKPTKFECEVCGKTYAAQSGLRRHMRTPHKKVKA